MVPSVSAELAASKVQLSPVQLEVKLAVGAAFCGAVSGATTIDHTTPRRFAESAVAVRPPAVPIPTGPTSATAAVMLPLPEPMVWLRRVTSAGSVQGPVSFDLSAQ